MELIGYCQQRIMTQRTKFGHFCRILIVKCKSGRDEKGNDLLVAYEQVA